MAPAICPLCRSEIRLVQFNLTEAVYLCINEKCTYPFNDPNQKLEIIQRDYKQLAQSPSHALNEMPPSNNVPELEVNLIESNLDEFLNKFDTTNTLPDSIQPEDLDEFDKFLQSL